MSRGQSIPGTVSGGSELREEVARHVVQEDETLLAVRDRGDVVGRVIGHVARLSEVALVLADELSTCFVQPDGGL